MERLRRLFGKSRWEIGAVISFSGEGPDEVFHPGFVKWCEDYLGIEM